MKTFARSSIGICLMATCMPTLAQDGDHPVTNGLGFTYLAPDGALPGVPVYNMSIGTAASDFATLRVRGDQLPVADQITTPALCTFRTDVAQEVQQSWWMYRDINAIGRIWNESEHRAFHVQSYMNKSDGEDRYSGLMLQNDNNDGMWIMNDGTPTASRAFPHAYQLLDAKGFAALGPRTGWQYVPLNRPRGPWSRFHLFHDVMGSDPWFAHRSQMRNGITLTGNSDHAYMGQWYDEGENGINAEVDDNSNLVIAVSEQNIPEGHAHTWDNISFRHFSDLANNDGAASTVGGLEMMRLQPARETVDDEVEGLVGVGDFNTAAAVPEERLDILDRTLRIRSMGVPGLYQNNGLSRVLVVDPTDGRVHWRNAVHVASTRIFRCTPQSTTLILAPMAFSRPSMS